METIRQDHLTVNEYSRPEKKLKEVKAIVLHWTANVGASAAANKAFFEGRKKGKDGYGSAHYIVDEKEIIECIPPDEVAYHCGSSQIDPASKKVYTDYAREKFGEYCANYKTNSPNNCTIGIEMVPMNEAGEFDVSTWNKAAWLTAKLLKDFALSIKDVTTHNQIVGWKNCPKLFTDKPERFEAFKEDVKKFLLELL